MPTHLVYLILAHRYPDHLVRLVRRLNTEDSVFLIHFDQRADDSIFRDLCREFDNMPNVRFVHRHSCCWGGFGIVQGTLEGIAASIQDVGSYDYLVLLSGQDYPLKSTHYIHQFFRTQAGKSFIDHIELPKPHWIYGGFNRVEHWHFRNPRIHLELPPRWFPRIPMLARKLPLGYKPFGGAQFWALHRNHVQHVHDTVRTHPELVRFFQHTDVPDELFFQTVLMNSPHMDEIVNTSLTYIEWSRDDPTLLSCDLPRLQSTPMLFARKIDPIVDHRVADLLDAHLDATSELEVTAQESGPWT